jgi:periplasmic divalent cation tolerance protein
MAKTRAGQFFVVLVTTPDLTVARRLAKAALAARLVACANLFPKIESHYWWKGRTERSNEALIVFKTVGTKLVALEKLVMNRHPYDTPEFLVMQVRAGNRRYLSWLKSSVT